MKNIFESKVFMGIVCGIVTFLILCATFIAGSKVNGLRGGCFSQSIGRYEDQVGRGRGFSNDFLKNSTKDGTPNNQVPQAQENTPATSSDQGQTQALEQ